MNAWFDRLRAALAVELGSEVAAELTRDDAMALLDMARDVAHGSGARQYAPLATYLAGRLVERLGVGDDSAARSAMFGAMARAAKEAGQAGPDPL